MAPIWGGALVLDWLDHNFFVWQTHFYEQIQ